MNNKNIILTEKEAYMAMFELLRQYYERGRSDEIGGMLGDLSLLNDETSADPAYSVEWKEIVIKIISDRNNLENNLSNNLYLKIQK